MILGYLYRRTYFPS